MRTQLKPNYTERYYDEVDSLYTEWRRSVWEDSLGTVAQESDQLGPGGWVEVLDPDTGDVIVEINQDGVVWDHAETHETGGRDEIDLTDLEGISAELALHLADTTDVHDHGSLSGLADNDHPQYALDADFDAHVADTTDVHGIVDTSDLVVSADLVHNHDSAYEAAGAVSSHEGEADPHAVYLLETAHTADPHTHNHDADYIASDDADWTDLTDGGETALHSHAGGGGVTDHGALTGLLDDDHTQYRHRAENVVIDNALITDEAIRIFVSGDTDDRMEITAAGTIRWGDGSSAADVSLSRDSFNTLFTEGLLANSLSLASGALSRFVPMTETSVVSASTGVSIASTLSGSVAGVPPTAVALLCYFRIQSTGATSPTNAVEVRHAPADVRAGIAYNNGTVGYFNASQGIVDCDTSQRIRYQVTRVAGTVNYYVACIGYFDAA